MFIAVLLLLDDPWKTSATDSVSAWIDSNLEMNVTFFKNTITRSEKSPNFRQV